LRDLVLAAPPAGDELTIRRRARASVAYTEPVRKITLASALFAFCAAHAATLRDIHELEPLAILKLGKTADWVAVAPDAVWVASSGPFAVHRIDPKTNQVTDLVLLTGEPCAGLVIGFGDLWVPLCAPKGSKRPPALAKVDLNTRKLAALYPVGPAAAEGGIAVSDDSVWLVTDKRGSLARIDPASGNILATLHIAAGSFNPHYAHGIVWVTRAVGSTLSGIDARSGELLAPLTVGPKPRFLTSGAGAVWTLNQGDGSVSRVGLETHATQRIALNTPGSGGDIQFEAGRVWSSSPHMPLSMIDASAGTLVCQWQGPGGDSLGLGFGAIWLTDYVGGTVSRISVEDAIGKCR
jgi:virginiamycin B lyase